MHSQVRCGNRPSTPTRPFTSAFPSPISASRNRLAVVVLFLVGLSLSYGLVGTASAYRPLTTSRPPHSLLHTQNSYDHVVSRHHMRQVVKRNLETIQHVEEGQSLEEVSESDLSDDSVNGYGYFDDDSDEPQLTRAEMEIEGEALMALFDAFRGRHWNNKRNWGHGIPCDTKKGEVNKVNQTTALSYKVFQVVPSYTYWEGVSCSIRTNAVTSLILESNNMKGEFPDLFQTTFTQLSFMDLSYNAIHGPLPPSFGQHTRLKFADFSYNNITALPESMEAMTIEYLVMSSNCLTELPQDLSDAHSLILLAVDLNNLTTINGSLPPNLNLLNIANNNIESLPSELETMKHMTVFDLSSNPWPSYPMVVSTMTSLEVLTLEYVNFGHVNLDEDCHDLCRLTNLRVLGLSWNDLQGELPSFLRNFALEELDLSHNNFSGVIPDNYFRPCDFFLCGDAFPTLVYLNLERNSFSGPLPSSITSVSTLQVLDFSHNDFSGDIGQITATYTTAENFLYNVTLGLVNLLELDLSFNQITGEIGQISQTQSVRLEKLLVNNNRLYGDIPNTIGDVGFLKKASFAHNYISGSIPRSLYDLAQLKHLDLHSNLMRGEVGWEIWKLGRLGVLDLHNNHFRGYFPNNIQFIDRVKHLDIRYNHFSGFLPLPVREICEEYGPNRVKTGGNDFWCYDPVYYDCNNGYSCSYYPFVYVYIVVLFFSAACLVSVFGFWALLNRRRGTYRRLELKKDAPAMFRKKRYLSLLLMGCCCIEAFVYTSVGVLGCYLIVSDNIELYFTWYLVSLPVLGTSLILRALAGFFGANRYYKPLLRGYIFTYVISVVAMCFWAFPGQLRSNQVYDMIVAIVLLIGFGAQSLGAHFAVWLVDLCVSTSAEFNIKLKSRMYQNQEGQQLDGHIEKIKQKDWYIYADDVSISRKVGSGGFGDVYRGSWRGTTVAVKKMHAWYEELNENALDEFLKEMTIMSVLRHPNVVLFIGASLEPPDHLLLTEYVALGSLRDVLDNQRIRLPWPLRVRMMSDAAKGMLYLHKQNPPIIHRDLKSPNLLVTSEFVVKVADFGLARDTSNVTMTRAVGTPMWTAPEVLTKNTYDEKADVFSFGIVMWEVLTREVPYEEANGFEILLEVTNGSRPTVPQHYETEHPLFVALMRRAWSHEPSDRPSFDVVLEELSDMLGGTVHSRTTGSLVVMEGLDDSYDYPGQGQAQEMESLSEGSSRSQSSSGIKGPGKSKNRIRRTRSGTPESMLMGGRMARPLLDNSFN